MSNLSDFIDAIKKSDEADGSAIAVIGGFIGLLADIGGAIGAVGILLNVLQGGSLSGISVGKQPRGEISGPATAQRVMQIRPSECWDSHAR